MLTLIDGRNKLAQWDTARKAEVIAECDRVHLANMEWGTAFVVDVVGGEIDIPDELLQSGAPLYAWAWVGSAENGYTKQSGKIEVERRPKPSDYVFTATEQESLKKLREQLGALDNLDTEARQNLVAAINEVLSKFVEAVGIVSIEQTVIGEGNGDTNVITVTLTNGVQHQFFIKNGMLTDSDKKEMEENAVRLTAGRYATVRPENWSDDTDLLSKSARAQRIAYKSSANGMTPIIDHNWGAPTDAILSERWQTYEATFTYAPTDYTGGLYLLFYGGKNEGFCHPYDIADVKLWLASDVERTNLLPEDIAKLNWWWYYDKGSCPEVNRFSVAFDEDGHKYIHVWRQMPYTTTPTGGINNGNMAYLRAATGVKLTKGETYVLSVRMRTTCNQHTAIAECEGIRDHSATVVSPVPTSVTAYLDSGVRAFGQRIGELMLKADTIPSEDITVGIKATRGQGTGVIIDTVMKELADVGNDTPIIGSNGNWWINGVDTGKPSRGQNGSSVTIKSVVTSLVDGGANVVTFNDGKELIVHNGNKGTTPHIGANGNWWIGDTDTGVSAGGTGDGGSSGGMAMELLWENADVESGFRSQGITLNNQNYSKLLIFMTTPYYYDYPYLYTTTIFLDGSVDKALPDQYMDEYYFNKIYPGYVCGTDTIGNIGTITEATRNVEIMQRDVTTGCIKSIWVYEGYKADGFGWSPDNGVMIPVRIYGIA